MILIMVLIPIPNLITSTSFFLGLPFSYLQFELLHLPKCYLPINKIIALGQLDFCLGQQYCRGESIYSFSEKTTSLSESGSPFGESFSLPERYVYSSSYNYSAQASLKGVRAVFIRIGGIYPIWSKRGSTCRTQACTDMKRADTISDTDSWIISGKSVFNFCGAELW